MTSAIGLAGILIFGQPSFAAPLASAQTAPSSRASKGAATPSLAPAQKASKQKPVSLFSDAVIAKALSAGVPRQEFAEAVRFVESQQSIVTNRKFISLVDFSKPIADPRMFVINMKTGEVRRFYVTHGKGSDPNFTGRAHRFSNAQGSKASSLGFYLTGEPYTGKFGKSMRLRGLSKTNSAAEARAVVLHPYYVGPGFEDLYARYRGVKCADGGCLTEGCLGIPARVIEPLIEHIKKGSIIYAFH